MQVPGNVGLHGGQAKGLHQPQPVPPALREKAEIVHIAGCQVEFLSIQIELLTLVR